jgi:hypothetical protein
MTFHHSHANSSELEGTFEMNKLKMRCLKGNVQLGATRAGPWPRLTGDADELKIKILENAKKKRRISIEDACRRRRMQN